MSNTNDCTDVAEAIAAGDVKQLTVFQIGKGRTFVEVSDLSQVASLLGGEGKKVTVDGQDASDLSGTPRGTETVTVAPEKGGNGLS